MNGKRGAFESFFGFSPRIYGRSYSPLARLRKNVVFIGFAASCGFIKPGFGDFL